MLRGFDFCGVTGATWFIVKVLVSLEGVKIRCLDVRAVMRCGGLETCCVVGAITQQCFLLGILCAGSERSSY